MNYKIKKISEVNQKDLIEFLNTVFPKRLEYYKDNWRWSYRIGFSNFEPILIIIESKIVGMAGLIPTNLKINGKILKAAWFTDFHILKEFRNKGLGKILVNEWMKISPLQITYCNDDSLRIFKKFGWKSKNYMERKIFIVNYLKFFPIFNKLNFLNKIFKKKLKKDIFIEPNQITEKNIDEYCFIENNKKIDENIFTIIRDKDWFKWRLLDFPNKSDIYEFKYEESVVVFRILNNKKIKRLHILYIFIKEKKDNEIFKLIFNWSLKNDIAYIWMISEKKLNIFKQNFLESFMSKTINFAYWCKDDSNFSKLENGVDNNQSSDSDLESIILNNK